MNHREQRPLTHLFFSDVHANYQALLAFAEHVKSLEGPVQLYFLGDLVGYYDFDGRTLDLFCELRRTYPFQMVLGNHDAKFLNTYFGTAYEVQCEIPFSGTVTENETLRAALAEQLVESKLVIETTIGAHKVIISHGGMADPLNHYFYPDLNYLAAFAEHYKHPAVYVHGHTHHDFCHVDHHMQLKIVNVGSLGMPRNKDVFATFVEWREGEQLIFKKLVYDLDAQFEANLLLANPIRNRVYFAGASPYLGQDLKCFTLSEQAAICDTYRDSLAFKRLILVQRRHKILKHADGYVLVRWMETNKVTETKHSTLDEIVKELHTFV
jgi:predicted phosphodiesterase